MQVVPQGGIALPGKGDPDLGTQQGFLQQTVGGIGVLQLRDKGGSVAGAGIYIVFAQAETTSSILNRQ